MLRGFEFFSNIYYTNFSLFFYRSRQISCVFSIRLKTFLVNMPVLWNRIIKKLNLFDIEKMHLNLKIFIFIKWLYNSQYIILFIFVLKMENHKK